MTITREDVAALRPGDVVELCTPSAKVTGELHSYIASELSVAPGLVLRMVSGKPSPFWEGWALTVISRAPRPLYVNHDRTKPVSGDVVREEDPEGATVWLMDSFHTWQSPDSTHEESRGFDWPLRLLVDGETGEVVP